MRLRSSSLLDLHRGLGRHPAPANVPPPDVPLTERVFQQSPSTRVQRTNQPGLGQPVQSAKSSLGCLSGVLRRGGHSEIVGSLSDVSRHLVLLCSTCASSSSPNSLLHSGLNIGHLFNHFNQFSSYPNLSFIDDVNFVSGRRSLVHDEQRVRGSQQQPVERSPVYLIRHRQL